MCWSAQPSTASSGASTAPWTGWTSGDRNGRSGAAIDRLTFEVDSLKRYAKRVETDRTLLEQLARENFGMIAKGEFLYHIESDSLDEQ